MSMKFNDVKFTNHLPQVLSALSSAQQESLQTIGEVITASAKSKTAVDTGEARDGWGFVLADDMVAIGNDVEHMVYLEYGTRRMKAQPALQPAIDEHERNIEAIVREKLQAKLK